MIAGPSNMAIFGALATAILPDLHLMGPGQQTRTLPPLILAMSRRRCAQYDAGVKRRTEIVTRHREAILAAAARNRARSIALVGSVARGEEVEHSDIDFLADFLPGATLFDVAGLQIELRELLDQEVDVVYRAGLRDHCRSMLDDAIPL